jgi:thiol-disulfide isomerase/thioredoxin
LATQSCSLLPVISEPDPIVPVQDPAPQRRSRRLPLGALTALVIAFVLVGVNLLGDDRSAGPSTGPEIGPLPTVDGNAAPDFSIELLDGTVFRLSTHLAEDGRPVVLNLWASWCGPCREEMPAFDAVATAHPEVFFLGVAVDDDPVAAEAFAAEIGVSYALAIDESDRVGRRYPSPGLPATYLISEDGMLLRTVFGGLDEGDITDLIAAFDR